MIESIAERTAVLTAHPSLARWLHLQYARVQRKAGRTTWPTPEILSLNAWLKKLWVLSWPSRHILSPLQARKTWEKIIRDDGGLPPLDLLHLQGTARQADEAYSLLKAYRIPASPEPFKWTLEAKSFLRWKRTYEDRLSEWRALDPADVADAVAEAMRDGLIPLPERIILAGFQEMTPQQRSLIDFLRTKEVPVQIWDGPSESNHRETSGDVRIVEFKDPAHEAAQCARWIRNAFRPEETVGIAVAGWNEYRSLIARELKAELTPDSIFPWSDAEPGFTVSMGTPLGNEPLVNLALTILSLESETVPFPVFSRILTAPFLAGNRTESGPRNALDLKLRRDNAVTVHLGRLEEDLRRESGGPGLTRLVQSIRELLRNREKKLPGLWAPDLSRFLKTLGWPDGDGILPNRVYQNQVRDAWRNCLDELASLDPVLGSVTRLQAVTVLESIARETSFQIKTREYPIQVISLPEAYGMQFDRLWILGCHADVLPPPPDPNPFLPLELQKRFDLPHSTSNRELQWAENILRQAILSSPGVVISYPAWNAEKELRASPLLKSLSSIQGMEEIAQSRRIKDQWRGKREMETWPDPGALPLTPDERQTAEQRGIEGGYKVLKNQADCPFRAFACHRLNAMKFETPEIDFNDAERGNIVHYALQRFWSEVKTSAQLRSLSDNGELPGVVARCVREAEGRLLSKLSAQKRFAELERSRLESLLGEWLKNEQLRPEFKVVAVERKETIGIAGYKFNVRVDRVDETLQGHTILIDYKTGKIQPRDWLKDRLQEPQLPLYAIESLPDAIAFAEVKKSQKGMGFKFLAREIPVLPGSPIDFKKNKEIDCPDWDSLLERWNRQLTALTEDFISGKCAVDPVDSNDTCKHCGLQTLCRIEELKPVYEDGGKGEES